MFFRFFQNIYLFEKQSDYWNFVYSFPNIRYELDQLFNCTFPHVLADNSFIWCNQG